MSEQAEYSLKMRQQNRKPEGDPNELNSKMEPAQLDASLDEGVQM